MSINNSDPVVVDIENGLSAGSGRRSAAETNLAKRAAQESYVRDLDASLGLYAVYYIGFVFVLVNFAEKWWHALLGVVFATAFFVLSLWMAANLRTRIMGEDAAERPGTDTDVGSKLLASEN